MNIVVILILAIVVASIAGFNQPGLAEKYNFNAWKILHKKEYHRLITHGFFHADWTHLIINMLVLYSFGETVLYYFQAAFNFNSQVLFLVFFLSALVVSSIYSLIKEKNNPYYNALGASGAVSGAVFITILFDPYDPIYLYGIIRIPGIILGVAYLVYSRIMSKKNVDNIGHDAHFWGAVYGFIFPLLFRAELLILFIQRLFFL
jgi:membrane associated rhomboid family serine protease